MIDPELDTDGDGLKDIDEVERYGTNPNVADTDGDGFDDRDEIVEKAFDADNNNFQFNPLIADVPQSHLPHRQRGRHADRLLQPDPRGVRLRRPHPEGGPRAAPRAGEGHRSRRPRRARRVPLRHRSRGSGHRRRRLLRLPRGLGLDDHRRRHGGDAPGVPQPPAPRLRRRRLHRLRGVRGGHRSYGGHPEPGPHRDRAHRDPPRASAPTSPSPWRIPTPTPGTG